MKDGYPIVLQLDGKLCVLIGGGKVALRKAKALLGAGASVKIVSPHIHKQLAEWVRRGSVEWLAKPYEPTALDGAWLVVAATDDEAVNRQVAEDAAQRQIWANVADQPELGSYTLPAVHRSGKLLIAVSTSGSSPSAAVRIRDELAQLYGEDYERYLELLQELRLLIQDNIDDTAARRELYKLILSIDWLGHIRQPDWNELRQLIMDTIRGCFDHGEAPVSDLVSASTASLLRQLQQVLSSLKDGHNANIE